MGSVTNNGPTTWVGRWLPLLCMCRLSTGLASSPADTHRNTHALVTVFCTPRPGWVHFGKCSGCIIPWLTQRDTELSMCSEIVQQQEATDSDCSSQTSSLSFILQQLFFPRDFHEHHRCPGAARSVISLRQERLSAVSHPHSSKEAPSGSLSSNDPAQPCSALTMLMECNTALETFRDCLSGTASVSSAQAAQPAADRSRVRKSRERRCPLGCKWQGTKRCWNNFMSTDGNLEHSQKKRHGLWGS